MANASPNEVGMTARTATTSIVAFARRAGGVASKSRTRSEARMLGTQLVHAKAERRGETKRSMGPLVSPEQTRIRDIMTTNVVTATPEDFVRVVVEEMTQRGISCVVVCEDSHAVGLVSERDLTAILGATLNGKPFPERIREVMTRPLVTLKGTATVADATRALSDPLTRRLVVVDDAGSVEGLVTKTDLLRWGKRQWVSRRFGLERAVAERTHELEEENRRLEALALEDSLLAIGNRRAMEWELEKQHGLAIRYGQVYAVALIDIDHFKSFNDDYGHLAGDDILRRIADTLSECTRTSDSIYRYGGEELLVLLPETRIAGARGAAKRARSAVYALAVPHRGSGFGVVTVSIGVSEVQMFDEGVTEEWREVVRRADRALYSAKKEGRNCVRAVTSARSANTKHH
jgi:diguanylate cyclase (GGDEF)-like protein